MRTRENSDFYDADGTFKEDLAREVYLEFLTEAGYAVSDELKENLWVVDFGLGRFTEVGMAGCFFINKQRENYTGLDMFLLPNQMIPEHWHVETPEAPVKMESWHCRWGESYTYGAGEPTAEMGVAVPEVHGEVTARHEKLIRVGQTAGLAEPCEVHWQMAGPAGAIVSEYSTFHDSAGVRFTNPKIQF